MIKVLFFSVLRDITHSSEVSWDWQSGTVADLLAQLYARWPALEKWDASLLVAVNLEYTRRGDPVAPGAEVAIMPPVQGG